MSSNLHAVAWPAEFLDHEASLAPATTVAFTEGPACAAGGTVYFSDIANNRILQFDPRIGRYSVWHQPSGRANGLVFDARSRLLVCEGNEWGFNDGGRRIIRMELHSGHIEVLTARFDGVRYNSPNDIAACSDGRIFFTDPCYGDRSTMEMTHESVYHIDPDGEVTRVLSQPEIERPNGVALSPEERILYVVDSCPVPDGNRKIWAFDLRETGALENQRLIYDFAPGRGGDGMAVDQNGNLYIAAGIARPRGDHETTDVPPGIYVMTAEGDLQGRIPIPEDLVTNVTFGGDDLKRLYVTAGKTLFTVRARVPGFVVHRR